MDGFAVGKGHFWLSNQPMFIHAGEFHYFRTPVEGWAHRLGLLQAAGFNTVAVYIPWLWHQPEPDVSDVDGHTHPMRDLAGFLDLAAEMGLFIIARPGPYIMAETINEGIPPWVFRQYPQASFIDQHGTVQNIASYLHPDFLKCVEGWYRAVFAVLTPRQISHGGKIVMMQIDNEMGMIHWVRNLLDTNPDTIARFADYLHQRDGEALAARHPAADLPAFLHQAITQPETPGAARVVEDYRRFFRVYLRDYAVALWKQAAAHGMDTPPVINIHGFSNASGRTFPIGLSQLVEVMAIDGTVSATDVYPIHIGEGNLHQLLLVNEMTKALHSPDQALFSIEFQAGGSPDFSGAQSSLYDLYSRLCISCGMRAINHYLFFDGENDPVLSPTRRHDWGHPVRKDGSVRRHYARYARLSSAITAYGADLVLSRPKTVTTTGFLIDQYMTEVNNSATQPATDILTHQREVIGFDFIARGLALTHRPFDALEITRTPLEITRTPTLWVMMEKQCEAAAQQKLADYVRDGGRLLLVGRLCEEMFDHAPCTILRDAIGIRGVKSDPPFTPALIQAFTYSDVPVSFLESYDGDFDEVFATSAQGRAVGFVKTIGQGRVMMLGAALAANTLDDLDILHQMANRMECAPLFTLSDWADVRLSEGENGSFLFVNNYQDDPISTTVSMHGVPLLGGHAITLPARRGVMLPIDWRVRPGVVIHFLTAEVIAVIEDADSLTLYMEPASFAAAISLTGWHPDELVRATPIDGARLSVTGNAGVLRLLRA